MASHMTGAESSIETQMPSMGMEKPKRSAIAPMMAGVVIVERPMANEAREAAEALRSGKASQQMSIIAPISPPWKNPPSGSSTYSSPALPMAKPTPSVIAASTGMSTT